MKLKLFFWFSGKKITKLRRIFGLTAYKRTITTIISITAKKTKKHIRL